MNNYESIAFSLTQDSTSSCLAVSSPLTGNLTKIGNSVTATFDQATGPSQRSANVITVAGSIPTRFLPSPAGRFPNGLFNVYVNGSSYWAPGTVNSSGVVSIYRDVYQNPFPAGTSNSVGIYDGIMRWTTS